MSSAGTMVITGTRRGIGRYLAEHYCGQGYQVIGCSRGAADFQAANYRHVELDVADEPAVLKLFSEIRRTYGGLDVLICNAGEIAVNMVLTTPFAQAQQVYRTNVLGVFLCCREAVKVMMAKRSGRIVNISSISVPMNVVGTGIYSSSKAAVEQFTRVLAAEAAPLNIAANALGLSQVWGSGMVTDGAGSKKASDEAIERTAIKRRLTLEEVGQSLDSLLAQPLSCTGQTIYLGGVS